MHPAEIRDTLRQRPFRPLRIFLSDGSSYEVRHPDLCLVTMTSVIIGLPSPKAPEGVPEATVKCAPEHVTHIEPVGEPASTS